MKKVLLIAAFLLTASPAYAATIVVTDTPITNSDVGISTSESNNNRTNNQNQQATIGGNEQNQEANQQANGGDQNAHGAVLPVNVAPAVNAAVPIQTGPIEVLTHKSIKQDQTYTDNSRYENHETTQIDNSRGKVTSTSQPVIVLDRAVKDQAQVIFVSKRVDNQRLSGADYKSGELPVTGVDIGRTLALALTLITTGFGMTRIGRIEG